MVLLACTSGAFAQTEKQVQQRTLSEILDSWIANTEIHVMQVADVMPGGEVLICARPKYWKV